MEEVGFFFLIFLPHRSLKSLGITINFLHTICLAWGLSFFNLESHSHKPTGGSAPLWTDRLQTFHLAYCSSFSKEQIWKCYKTLLSFKFFYFQPVNQPHQQQRKSLLWAGPYLFPAKGTEQMEKQRTAANNQGKILSPKAPSTTNHDGRSWPELLSQSLSSCNLSLAGSCSAALPQHSSGADRTRGSALQKPSSLWLPSNL